MESSFVESGLAEATAHRRSHLCFDHQPTIIFVAGVAAVNWLCRYGGIWHALLVCILALVSTPPRQRRLQAAVDLVTLPTREGAQLTIYNSEDITMVREHRLLTVKEGVSRAPASPA